MESEPTQGTCDQCYRLHLLADLIRHDDDLLYPDCRGYVSLVVARAIQPNSPVSSRSKPPPVPGLRRSDRALREGEEVLRPALLRRRAHARAGGSGPAHHQREALRHPVERHRDRALGVARHDPARVSARTRTGAAADVDRAGSCAPGRTMSARSDPLQHTVPLLARLKPCA